MSAILTFEPSRILKTTVPKPPMRSPALMLEHQRLIISTAEGPTGWSQVMLELLEQESFRAIPQSSLLLQ
jgi:hypothetical protein